MADLEMAPDAPDPRNTTHEKPDEPEMIGKPGAVIEHSSTTSEMYIPPPPPPEGYTLDQWIAEREIRAKNRLAAAQDRLAEETRAARIAQSERYDSTTDRRR